MNVTPEEVAVIAQQLAAVAGVFSPQNAAAIALLTQTATSLNTLIHKIATQNDANAQQVWQQVSTDFRSSVQAFQASVAPATPATQEKPHA